MVTTPYTEDELRARIRTLEDGLLQVLKGASFADRGVQYKTAAELEPSIAYFKGLLTSVLDDGSAISRRSKQTYGVLSSGF